MSNPSPWIHPTEEELSVREVQGCPEAHRDTAAELQSVHRAELVRVCVHVRVQVHVHAGTHA